MTYVVLLRGINVGGKRKVDMKRLKEICERVGMKEVRTYINSGNVIFQCEADESALLAGALEAAIQSELGFPVKVFLRDAGNIRAIVAAMPADWVDGDEAKCDVLFLDDSIDAKDLLGRLTIKPGIDEVKHVPGAIFWRVERAKVTRSGLLKLAATEWYAKMTVRNCNTVRKLGALMEKI